MHASTRILLLLLAMAAVVGGLWVLFSVNTVVDAILYGALWTLVVLIATRILLAVGSGFNWLTDGRRRASSAGPRDAGTGLAELADLRARDLISAEEYEAKRSEILERL